MKQFLYRAKALILIIVMVSMLASLGATAYEKKIHNDKKFPYYSNQSVVGAMSQNEEVNKVLTKEKLVKKIRTVSDSYYFSAELGQADIYAVFNSDDRKPSIVIDKGRWFSKLDFDKNRNTAVVREDKAVEPFFYAGKPYQVIGTYLEFDKYGNQYPSAVLNYCADNIGNEILNVNYIYDCGSKSESNAHKISSFIMKTFPEMQIEYAAVNSKESRQYFREGSNIKAMLLLVVLITLMVLLNAFSTCQNWIEGKKKEIAVRRMVGADSRNIYKWVCTSFFLMTTMSYGVGVILSKIFLVVTSKLPVAQSTGLMFGMKLFMTGIIAGYIIVLCLCMAVLLVNLRKYRSTEIIGGLR